MNKFVFVSFAFLGWVFWELSGGSDFEPKTRPQVAEAKTPNHVGDAPVVARTALSVPIVNASGSLNEAKPHVQPAVVSATEVVPSELAVSKPIESDVAVVVASLSEGIEAFATPGFAALNLPTVTNEPPQNVSESQSAQIKDLRQVRGSRVNLRAGPGTSYGVLSVLSKGQNVEILDESGSGWVKLRDQESRIIGWMSSKMLTQQAPSRTN